ncbi:MAG: hypothetical protein ACMXYA_02365, partial [Candidatus Woesearchaeota archaeon]
VMDKNAILGYVTEKDLLEYAQKTQTKIEHIKLNQPPIVPEETPLHIVKNVLTYFPIIMVKKTSSYGIISREDYMKNIA